VFGVEFRSPETVVLPAPYVTEESTGKF